MGNESDWRDTRAMFLAKNAFRYQFVANTDDIFDPIIHSISELDSFKSTPTEALQDWMEDAHTRSVIRGNYNNIGIGVFSPETHPAAVVVLLVNVVSSTQRFLKK
jgi:hypothetical protein